ncbi:MAG: hypothetical protein ACOC6N_03230, partial [archaeon]
VYRDAEKRGQEPALWLLVNLDSNILGLILWLILRPEKKKEKMNTLIEKITSSKKFLPLAFC